MSTLECIRCCHRLYSLLKEKSDCELTGGIGFKFENDGLYMTSQTVNNTTAAVQILRRKNKDDRSHTVILPSSMFDPINELCRVIIAEAIKNQWSIIETEMKLRRELLAFFTLNHQKLD